MSVSDPLIATARGDYARDGFAIVELYGPPEQALIRAFAEAWLGRLIEGATGRAVERPLSRYHQWWAEEGIDHDNLLRARNRHTRPPAEVAAAVVNRAVRAFLEDLPGAPYRSWDEGLGWLAFRLIRPGMGDGYPTSRKEWGPAKRVVSLWIPVIGRSARETIALVPGSHLKEYPRYLPSDGKFCADEYRLADPEVERLLRRPSLAPGEGIFFHPRTLHTEDVTDSPTTRFSLEVRFAPAGN